MSTELMTPLELIAAALYAEDHLFPDVFTAWAKAPDNYRLHYLGTAEAVLAMFLRRMLPPELRPGSPGAASTAGRPAG